MTPEVVFDKSPRRAEWSFAEESSENVRNWKHFLRLQCLLVIYLILGWFATLVVAQNASLFSLQIRDSLGQFWEKKYFSLGIWNFTSNFKLADNKKRDFFHLHSSTWNTFRCPPTYSFTNKIESPIKIVSFLISWHHQSLTSQEYRCNYIKHSMAVSRDHTSVLDFDVSHHQWIQNTKTSLK